MSEQEQTPYDEGITAGSWGPTMSRDTAVRREAYLRGRADEKAETEFKYKEETAEWDKGFDVGVAETEARYRELVTAAEWALERIRQGFLPPWHIPASNNRTWNDAFEAFRDSGIFSKLEAALPPVAGAEAEGG